jgi:tetratricopeptide (TPR) repeat protein
MRVRPGRLWALVLVAGLLAWGPVCADQVLDQAKQLLEARRAREAFDLLRPLEARRAGEIEFDYLLGIAALDAGDAQSAVFALERVLAVNPNYLQARAEIARAYFVLGEKENARREFQTVRAQNPPEAARQTIDRYLSALEPQTTQLRGYIEVAGGYDSNVNSATSRSQIALPALGGAIGTLDPSAQAQGAWFGGFGAGGSVSHAVSPEWWVLGNVAYTGKFNANESQFDTSQVDGSAGVRWARGPDQVIGLVQGQEFRLDGNDFRTSLGGTAQWLHNLSDVQQFTVFGQYAALRYPDQSPRDADRWIGGVAYSQAFPGALAPIGYASAYGGAESTTDDAFNYLGFRPVGLRLGGQVTLLPQVVGFAAASWENRRYRAEDPSFLVRRSDNQYDARVGVAYGFLPSWTLTPQVAYTKNDSNIELNEYDRTVASVTVRRDF